MGKKGRIGFLRLAVVCVLLILVGRLTWVQVVKAEEIRERIEDRRLVKKPLEPLRGAVMDRHGRYLAISLASYTAAVDVRQIKPEEYGKRAMELAGVLGLDAAKVLKQFQENPQAGYVVLKKGLDLEAKQAVEALRIGGVYFEQQLNRKYPQGHTGNHVLGYMGDGKGAYGIEARYEKMLAGEPGWVVAEMTGNLTPIEGTIKQQVEPRPGYDLVLTLDASLNQLAEAKLEEVIKQQDAKRGLILVMDVNTGEILVMAMRPGADPGDRSTWGNPVDFDRINNWAVTPMPPGSMFKTITLSAALEERAVTLNSTFVDEGRLVIDGWPILNWDQYIPPRPRPETAVELMQRSSNVGLIKIGQQLERDQFVKYLKGFGFMEETGIDLSYEEGALGLERFNEKKDIDWANMFIGQHLEVTPVQMISAVAAIANGGKLVQPHLLREVRDPEGKVIETTPTAPRRQVISEQTAREMRDVMVGVVEKGAVLAQTPGYTVAGKTGTAQKFDPQTGKMKDRHLANFIGFAPANNPQVIMLVMIDEPKPPGLAGTVSAPVFADFLPHVMRAVGIAPDSAAALGKETAPPAAVAGVVPDVRWLPVSWAQQRLAAAGFTAKLSGTGELVGAQALQPGATAKEGTEVELVLTHRPAAGQPVHVPEFRGLSLAEAVRLANEVGLTLKAGGSGFVSEQEPKAGSTVPERSAISVRLAPRP